MCPPNTYLVWESGEWKERGSLCFSFFEVVVVIFSANNDVSIYHERDVGKAGFLAVPCDELKFSSLVIIFS